MLDRLIPELIPVLQRRTDLRARLTANRGTISGLTSQLQAVFNRSDRQILRFREFTADFARLNTDEVRESFAALDLARAKQRLLTQLVTNTTGQIARLESLTEVSLRDEVNRLLEEGPSELREWWFGTAVQALDISGAETGIAALAQQIVERLRTFLALLNTRGDAIVHEIGTIECDIQSQFDAAGDDSMQRIADLRANAERRLAGVAEIRRQYLLVLADIERALQDRIPSGTGISVLRDCAISRTRA